MRVVRTLTITIVLPLVLPLVARAQNPSFKGRVITDSTELPIPGVVVAIEQLKLQATTDSAGAFIIPNIKPGAYIVTARKIGFGPLATRMRFANKEDVDAELLLTPNVTALPDVTVKAAAPVAPKLQEFEERRLSGSGGRFLTQADLEKHAYANFGDAMRALPGLEIQRSGRDLIAVAGRMSVPSCALCGGGGAGPPPPCPAAVAIDGAFVFQGNPGEKPFNLNQISPGSVAGVEYYVGGASMPVKYNATRATCGLVIIWTK